MKLTSIASGSSGNCTLVSGGTTNILVDAGISCKRIKDNLTLLGVMPESLKGLLITHEHSDHVGGLYVFEKRYRVPIYAPQETIEEIRRMDKKDEIDPELYRPIAADEWFTIGDLSILAFNNLHDAACPVGYRIECGDRAAAVCTDLGNYTGYTVRNLLGLDALLIESNHDLNMLQVGPYPYQLKRRVMSDYGHLANERCGQLLCEIANPRLKYAVLGHLSQENNIPQLALDTVRAEVNEGIDPALAEQIYILVAKRDEMTETIEF